MTRDAEPDPRGRALVFDMDGVLVDSEPLWRRAEVACFGRYGLALEESDCVQTMGLRIDEAVEYWIGRRAWTPPSVDEVATAIIDEMETVIRAEARPIAGVEAALGAAEAEGWRLGLASSSPMRLIEATLDTFGLGSRFEVRRSAEHEKLGKPHPDVYRSTLHEMGVDARGAIAIEDSANGVASAMAAGMRCVAIPEPAHRDDPRFEAATWRMDSLNAFAEALPRLRTESEDEGA